jgi:hypothetical protein
VVGTELEIDCKLRLLYAQNVGPAVVREQTLLTQTQLWVPRAIELGPASVGELIDASESSTTTTGSSSKFQSR